VDSTPNNDDGDQSEDDEDNAETNPNPVIDLSLVKTVSDATPNVGDDVIFTISVTNDGPSVATGVTVTDNLPSGYSFVSSDGDYVGGLWTIGTIGIGETVTLNVTATVLVSGDYFNVAEVTTANEDDVDSTPNNDDGDQSEDDEDNAETNPNPVIDLSLVKTVSDATPNVGDDVIFTISVTNDGPSVATGVTVTDNPPSGYSFVSSDGDYVGGLWTIGTIGIGETVTLNITATVLASGDYFNVAEVTSANEDDVDSTPNNDDGDQSEDDEDNAVTNPNAVIDLSLTKVVDDATPNVGDDVIFTISVTNDGPSVATGVTVTDNLPSGYSFVSSDGDYVGGLWTIGTIGIGETVTLNITATVLASGDYFNVAEVTSANEDDVDSTPNNDDGDQSEDDEDNAETNPNPVIDLSLVKTVSDAIPNVGDDVIFTISVTNDGPSVATGVTVTDNLPSGYSFVSSDGDYVGGLWTIGTIGVGETVTLNITATVLASGDYFNVAEVTTANEDDVDSTPNNDDGDQSEDDEDNAETNPSAVIDLSLTKVVDDATPNVGDDVIFTISVTNDGPSVATGVTVTDNLPSGYSFVSSDGDYVGGLWTIGTIGVGETVTLNITATVLASGDYFNVAEVTSANEDDVDSTPNNDDGDQSEDDEDNAETNPSAVIDLSLTKVVDDATPNVGDDVIFTISVTNDGPSVATGVTVTDNLPSGYSFVSSDGDYVGGLWTIGTIGVGETVTLNITATVLASGDYFNVAEVTSANEDDVDSTPNNDDGDQSEDDEDNAVTNPSAVIDLSLTKVVSEATPNVGDDVIFTVSVTNDGPSVATGVTVTDNLPSGYSFVSSDGDYVGGLWTIGTIGVGETVTLNITATVLASGDYFNVAEVTTANEDDVDSTPNNDDGDQSEDDEDNAVTNPNAVIDLSLTKVVDDATPNVGDDVIFTISVTNDGPSVATGVTVTDNLPSGYSFVSSDGDYVGGLWTIGTIGVGETVTLNITATVLASGDYFNVAEVTSANEDDVDSTPNNDDGDQSEDDEDNAVTNPNAVIDLSLVKTVNDATPNVGDDVIFTISVTNDGPSVATGVAVTDNLPSGYSYVSSNGAYNDATGIWTVGTINAGQTVSLQITATVLADGDYVNLAEVSAANEPDVDSTPGNGADTDGDGDVGPIDNDGSQDADDEDDGDDAEVTPNAIIDLSLTKVVNDATPNVGDDVIFTINVTNDGPSVATGVSVTDNLPSGYSFVSSDGDYVGGLWTIGTIGVGETVTLNITATVLASGDYFNVAEVTSANEDDVDSTPNNDDGDQSEDDEDNAVTNPNAVIDLSLIKTVNDATPNVGDDVIFTISVTNDGPSVATGVAVTDNLPSGYSYVSSNGAYNDATGIWTVGTINAGQTVSLQITATVLADGDYVNLAEVSAANEPDVDSTPGNGADTDGDGDVGPIDNDGSQDADDEDDGDDAEVTPSAVIDLSLIKTVNDATPNVGDDVIFTISVTNDGPSVATGVAVTDNLPSGYSYVSSTGAYNDATGIWTIGTIGVGQTVNLQITATVLEAGDYVNLAEVTAANEPDVDSTPGNGADTDGDGNVGPIDNDGSQDADDEDDGDDAEVTPACEVEIVVVRTICDDNGTSSNPNDDTWTFEVNVNGLATSGSWSGTLAGQPVSGNYNEVITFGPFAISNGPVTMYIADTEDPNCSDVQVVTPPQTCSEVCEIVVTQPQTPYCDDNGTDFDPSDDVYYVVLEASGFNLDPTGWTATDNFGNNWEGNYDAEFTFGPYDFDDGAVTISFTDKGDGACQDAVTVNPPDERCSDACLIEAVVENIICDPNGTPYDNSDDQFVALVTVSGYNTGSFWRSNDPKTPNGQYDVVTILGPFPISGGDKVITFKDNADSGCSASVLLRAPDQGCSNECLIDAVVNNVVCDDQGTADPSDDTYSFDVTVLGQHNYGNCWNQKEFGYIKATGEYGVATTFGPYLISEGPKSLTFRDCTDDACTVKVTVDPPAACSDDICELDDPVVTDITCTNANDGTFTFDLLVSGTNTSGSWTATGGGVTFSGNYGEPTTSPAIAATGELITFSVVDGNDGSCSASVDVQSPDTETCATCELTAFVSNVSCTDANDGTYTFDILVTGTNTGGSWTATGDGISFSGNYGELTTSPALPADGSTVNLTITDSDDTGCTDSATFEAPSEETCATCELTAAVSNVSCTDANDGTYTFDILVTGTNTGGSWTATGDGISFSGNYGELTTSPALPADGSTVNLTITDSDDTGCTDSATFQAPSEETCATCELTAAVSNVSCTDANDGTYTFDILVTGTNTGGSWTATGDGISFSGNYGELTTSPALPADGSTVNLTITDSDDSGCTDSATFQAPSEETCATCELTAAVSNVSCTDANDGTYTFDILVTGTNTGGSWTATGDGISFSGNYGELTTSPALPADGSTVNLTITDSDDTGCTDSATFEAPSEETCATCELTAAVSNVSCTDANDGTYTFDILVTGTNTGGSWTATGDGISFSGNYGELTTSPALPADGSTVNLTITDSDDTGCTDSATFEAPAADECEVCDIVDAKVTDISCADSNDGTFTFDLLVTGTGTSSTWTATGGGVTFTGNYGEVTTSPTLPASGLTISFVVSDSEDSECKSYLALEAPTEEECSECRITDVDVSGIDCTDANNGTYTFDILVEGANTGSTWTAIGTGINFSGNYGELTTSPVLTANGQSVTLLIIDSDDPGCNQTVTFTAPSADECAVCEVTAEVSNITCAESGGQYFTFDLTVNGENTGGSWVATGGGVTFSGAYGETVTSPVLVSLGEELTFTITDKDDGSCATAVTVEIPDDCGACNLLVDIQSITCDPEGTMDDNDDDTFSFVLTLSNGVGTGWVSADGQYSGNYGEAVVISGIPISAEAISIQAIDNENSDCQAAIFVNAPAPCSVVCSLEVLPEDVEIMCTDNGTPDDISDDMFTYTIKATATDAGMSQGYMVLLESTGELLGMSLYGNSFSPTLPLMVADGSIEIRVVDMLDPDCYTIVTIDPSICTACAISADVSNISCHDNDTPNDLEDDVFYFDLTVSEVFGSAGWVTEDGTQSGAYGETITLGPFPISGGDVSLTITDQEDASCSTTITAAAPAPCSEAPCDITVNIESVDCDDQGTPDDASDDTYTATVTVLNSGLNTTWTSSTGASGTYGETVVLGPFPIADQEITITDSADGSCSAVFTVTPPLPVVECPDDVSGYEDETGEFQEFICTDADFLFNNPESLGLTGEPTVVSSCGLDFIDFTDEMIEGDDCDQLTILRTFTIHSLSGATTTCEQRINVRKPKFADLTLPAAQDFACDAEFATDENGNPHPDVTGYPYLSAAFGDHLLNSDYCNLSASYEDEASGGCEADRVITRTWTITDACLPGETLTHEQIITIEGTGTPVITCPEGMHDCPVVDGYMIFETQIFECAATVSVPMPDVDYDGVCGEATYELITEILNADGEVLFTLAEGDPRILEEMAAGEYAFRYTLTNDCGTEISESCLFKVVDRNDPVAICMGNFNVSVGGYGLARIRAEQFDNGSYDYCGDELTLEVRRKYTRDAETCEELETPVYSEWGPYIDLTCCDAGTNVLVELRVTDVNGNSNMCWLEILVEDKVQPYCTGLEDLFVNCDDLPVGFDAFDTEVMSELFGMPEVIDNCSAEAIELTPIVDLDECGGGTIIRRFNAVDRVGNLSFSEFEQLITIEACTDCNQEGLAGGEKTPEWEINFEDLRDNSGTPVIIERNKRHPLPGDDDPKDGELDTEEQSSPVARAPKLYQNYPNPFNKTTKIGFELPNSGQIDLMIMDGTGKVHKMISGEYPAGYNEVILQRGNLPTGVLYYIIKTDEYTVTRKMVIMR
ncbi:T9SS type A sorting domain-containing protein, partial [Flavilitoribacter nigricans]